MTKISKTIFVAAAGCLLALGLLLTNVMGGPKADPSAVFPVEELVLETSAGEFSITVEIADEEAERQRGLMMREQMLPTHGMLFDFGRKQPVYMWMANTILPLDMLFVRPDGSIARIEQNTEPFSRKVIESGEPVTHVLELNAGISKQLGIKPGDRLVHRFFENKD